MLWSLQKAFRNETVELEEDMDELKSGMCTQTIIDFTFSNSWAHIFIHAFFLIKISSDYQNYYYIRRSVLGVHWKDWC